MIQGFEEQTQPLNDLELHAASAIAECLRNHHVGKEKAVTGDAIGRGMAQYKQYRTEDEKPYLTGARVRKIVNYIRFAGWCPRLIANSNGYYVSNDAEELKQYVQSLRARANAINAVADKLEKE